MRAHHLGTRGCGEVHVDSAEYMPDQIARMNASLEENTRVRAHAAKGA